MSAAEADHAHVRFPPPLLYVGVVGAGSILDRTWPVPITGPRLSVTRRLAGAAFVVVAVGLNVGALQRFHRARTSIVPIRPATALVVDGPYRFTRNPMYLALTLGTAGFGLLRDNLWVLALLPPAVVVADAAFIRREERYLHRRFGDAYRAYQARVRRWI